MNTDIQRIKNTIESETGVNLNANTRKRNVVHARRMYYKILKLHTNMSLDAIGNTLKLNQDHATVLHQIKMFDGDYKNDKSFNAMFRKIMNVLDGVIEASEEDKLKDKNLLLNSEVLRLKDEIEALKKEIDYLRPKAIQPRNQQTKIYYCSEGISDNVF